MGTKCDQKRREYVSYLMNPAVDERNKKAIEGITCPVCQAEPGESCSFENRWNGRTVMKHPHKERMTSFEHHVWIRGKRSLA